ncbi:hypothetical protein ASD11_07150 [Aeromicrobium sp. Root495]|uniref:PstS family phosphate ABC transporter substrate-binding protein n=1 Tax=Aeromicrobium sp. Root495 TaxID=1736550 RepID=UPI0006F91CEC|nr:Ig-like domain repeat protein [Aeromicrobium sp. Root495]KQY59339.1 hypothetical protein ASD11_07150 [Aeromicrobium sp. Root495]
MTRSRTTWRASLALAAVSAVALGTLAPAQASAENPSDPEFTAGATDFVGVGSDTTQIVVDHLADGYNAGKTTGRIASYAADGTPSSLSLRSGSAAIERQSINGSGAGKLKLYSPSNPDVSFARSSSGPSTAEVGAKLQFFPYALDGIKIAVKSTGSHAPASITVSDLVKIYTGQIDQWNEIAGNASGSSDTIKALIPQSGSGTRSYFLSLLQAANGGNAITSPVATVTQEHSDADIKNDPNALAPFSTARAKSSATIKVLGGWGEVRPVYNVLRENDAKKADFLGIFGKSGFICSPAGRTIIEAAGFDQLASQSRGGVCGVPTQTATTNLRTARQGDATVVTTTDLAVLGTPSGKVSLSATLAPQAAGGSVEFFEVGGTKSEPTSTQVGETTPVKGGTADLVLTGVAPGQHTYEARYTPSDVNLYGPSTSATATADVAGSKFEAATTVTAPDTAWGTTKTVSVTVAKNGVKGTGSASFVYADKASVTRQLDSSGKVAFSLPATTPVGTYWGVVSYSGDANFAKDFSLVKLVVKKATTKTTLKLAASKVKVKKATKGKVTVVINGTAQKAAGTVTLKIGKTTVGTGKVVGGKATVTIKAQTKVGKKSVKATFTPSSSNYGSSSATATYTVVK